MNWKKKEANQRRHQFLLTLFPDKKEEYAVLPMNGFVLVRQFNGNTGNWQVAIFTEETFNKKQDWLQSSDQTPLHRKASEADKLL